MPIDSNHPAVPVIDWRDFTLFAPCKQMHVPTATLRTSDARSI
jgi:hypothetical protein